MRKTFCDKCGKEIKTDVEMVFGYELCSECAKAIDDFITYSSKPSTMDELRDFCENFSKSCKGCLFYDKDPSTSTSCQFGVPPCEWPSEEEIYSKLLDYKINHPDWRKKEEK